MRGRRVDPSPGVPSEAKLFAVQGERFVLIELPDRSRPAALSALTPAEREVLLAIARGATNAAIAAERGTSMRTVANQVAALLRKLGASSRGELVVSAWEPEE